MEDPEYPILRHNIRFKPLIAFLYGPETPKYTLLEGLKGRKQAKRGLETGSEGDHDLVGNAQNVQKLIKWIPE